jgi:hypothetical protein
VTVKPAKRTAEERKAMKALAMADQRVAFGPLFFMQQLRGLVRDRCPIPAEGIPSVQIHLLDGDVLEICHIIGVSPSWIALAVHEEERPESSAPLRTEMVPFHLISRVTIQADRHGGAHPIGFNADLEPSVIGSSPALGGMTPEEALKAVAGLPVRDAAAPDDAPGAGSKRVR